jgi:hypothetical protein
MINFKCRLGAGGRGVQPRAGGMTRRLGMSGEKRRWDFDKPTQSSKKESVSKERRPNPRQDRVP